MTRRTITSNVEGRVKKIRTSDPFVPLYEAISNSIHAIEAIGGAGAISATLLRESKQADLPLDLEAPITGIEIIDDGVGFDRSNIDSFCEADSPHKVSVGGKGVGRFTWLKFFDRAVVDSTFRDGEKGKRRRFTFSLLGVDESAVVATDSPRQTRVLLSHLHPAFEKKTRKSVDDVAIGIIEHFLAYFVTDAMPKLTLHDGSKRLDVVELYRANIGSAAARHKFQIHGREFEATSVKFYLGNSSHTGFLCGHKRVAERVLLGRRDQFLSERFPDRDLKKFALQVFVQSPYLDEIVHDDRDGFRFPESGTIDLDALDRDGVTKEEIATEVLKIAHEVLEMDIARIRLANLETVRRFVTADAPQYRRVLAERPHAAEEIHDRDPIKIDQHLRRIQFEGEQQTRAEIRSLLVNAPATSDIDAEWQEKSAAVLEKLSEEGKATLAAYIVKRKLILELLEKRIEVTEESHAREEAVHRLIFPMRATSDEVDYESHNLWILDERLAYHYYLASDKALTSTPPAGSSSRKEPDIIVFNRPIALNNREESEKLESIVVIEFKRPGETGTDGSKTPVSQILEYIELLRDGGERSRTGRVLHASGTTNFFGYAICDLNPALKAILKRSNMRELPDGRGMFGFFEDHRAYVEVISYEKLIDDAKKRNRILFEKLALPARITPQTSG